jgi:peroxiredoxin
MLGPGDAAPDARVWRDPADGPTSLREQFAPDGSTLLCFYPFDWSPT